MGSADAGFKEKAASWLVTTGMKAKRRLGGGCGFKNIVGVAKKAIQRSAKSCGNDRNGALNLTKLIGMAVSAAKRHAGKRKIKKPRVIRIPKSGGALSMIPVFAGLSALGALVGGVGSIVKAIRDVNSTANTGSPVHLGKGLYLHPYKGGSYRVIKMDAKSRLVRSRVCKKNVKKNKKKNKLKKTANVRRGRETRKTTKRCGAATRKN